jgi:hypothetical protein
MTPQRLAFGLDSSATALDRPLGAGGGIPHSAPTSPRDVDRKRRARRRSVPRDGPFATVASPPALSRDCASSTRGRKPAVALDLCMARTFSYRMTVRVAIGPAKSPSRLLGPLLRGLGYQDVITAGARHRVRTRSALGTLPRTSGVSRDCIVRTLAGCCRSGWSPHEQLGSDGQAEAGHPRRGRRSGPNTARRAPAIRLSCNSPRRQPRELVGWSTWYARLLGARARTACGEQRLPRGEWHPTGPWRPRARIGDSRASAASPHAPSLRCVSSTRVRTRVDAPDPCMARPSHTERARALQ